MKRSEQDRVWREVFSDEVERLREESLQAGLRLMRQKRIRRRIVSSGAAAAVALALAATLWRDNNTAVRPVAIATTAHSAVKFISDDELLALFPDRPAALIGSPGRQQLMFLDSTKKSASGNESVR
jgi:hypothetical protein